MNLNTSLILYYSLVLNIFLKHNLYKIFKMHFSTVLLFSMIAIISFLHETEARRKILRGRKTITRTYYKSLGIPAWLSITFIGLIILGISGIIFAVLQKFIIVNNQPPQQTPSSVPLRS